MHVINLWGGPSSGKSTTAAGLFYLMKINKLKVELVTEYAKDIIWSECYKFFEDQNNIFSQQHHRIKRLQGKVDYVITDSPLPLAFFYAPEQYSQYFPNFVMEQFNLYNNINFLLKRISDFENFGRIHDENQSNHLAESMIEFLNQNNIQYMEFNSKPETPNVLLEHIIHLTNTDSFNTDISRNISILKRNDFDS